MLINKQVINVVKFYAYGAELTITLTISSVAMVCNRRATLLQILSLSIPKDLSSVFNRENFCRSSWTFWLFSLASLVFSPNENPPNLEKKPIQWFFFLFLSIQCTIKIIAHVFSSLKNCVSVLRINVLHCRKPTAGLAYAYWPWALPFNFSSTHLSFKLYLIGLCTFFWRKLYARLVLAFWQYILWITSNVKYLLPMNRSWVFSSQSEMFLLVRSYRKSVVASICNGVAGPSAPTHQTK